MIVTFYKRTGATHVTGSITMTDGVLVDDPPDEIALQNVLRHGIQIDRADDQSGVMLHATHDPAAFLKALPQQYGHGSYFWCKQVED